MTPQQDELTVDLDIEGMTCASCVSRVERRLAGIDGVHAQVNLATERARVRYAPTVRVAELVEAVRSAGYGASVSTRAAGESAPAPAAATDGKREPVPVAIMARPLDVPVRRPVPVAITARPVDVAGEPALDLVPSHAPKPALPSEPADAPPAGAPARTPRRDPLRLRLIVSAVLTVPVIVLAMVPALQFPGWQWASLVLATCLLYTSDAADE